MAKEPNFNFPISQLLSTVVLHCVLLSILWGWVGLWGFLWWAPSAKRKNGKPLRGQLWMEQYLISLKYWPILYTIWADPNYIWGLSILADSLLFFGSITFWRVYVKLYFICWNYSLLWMGVRFFFKVVATFSHVGRSFNLFMASTRDSWIIPSFQIWDYVLHVEHVSCVITNCGQHQWVIPSSLLIAL